MCWGKEVARSWGVRVRGCAWGRREGGLEVMVMAKVWVEAEAEAEIEGCGMGPWLRW